MQFVIYIAIGLLAGVMSGLFGIGGGIVIVPLLVAFAGMSQITAQGTSIGVLLLPMGFLGALRYHQDGNLNWRVALMVAIGLGIGVHFGAGFAAQLPINSLRKVFGGLLVLVGCKFLFS